MQDYIQGTTNWREQLKKNQRKTKMVIGVFIGLYVLVGFIIDTLLYMNFYQAQYGQVVDPLVIIRALVTFRVVPYATLILGVIAVLSLWATFVMYDRIMLMGTDAHEVTRENARTPEEQQLYNVIEEMKVASGLHYMPKVYLIEAEYMNAFASGYSEKSAMVAITRGLIARLNREELQAVMAHELSHIRHGDIKLTLTVAVLSNIMLLVIDMLFYNMLFSGRRDNEGNKNQIVFLVIMILRYTLPLITVLLTFFLSRTREYMADAGAVELTRHNEPLARALMKITYDHREHANEYSYLYGETPHEDVRRASYIYDPSKIDPVKSLTSAFSTHPSLEQRLKALGFKKK